MSLKEKRIFAVVLALVVALTAIGGYLFATLYLPSEIEQRVSPIMVGPPEQMLQPKTLTITGIGTIRAEPDAAELRLGVVTEAETASEALAKNKKLVDKVILALVAAGIHEEGIETLHFALSSKYSPQMTIVGFEATRVLRITTIALDKVGHTVDEAVKAGVNRVEVFFTFSEEKLDSMIFVARRKALGDAQTKAKIMAELMDTSLMDILNITEDVHYPRLVGAEAPAALIVPELEVTVTVRIVYIVG